MDQINLNAPSGEASVASKDVGPGIGENFHEYNALFQHFGLDGMGDKQNPRYQQALGRIWTYAKSVAPSKDKDSVLFEVIRLGHRLGSPSVGQKPYAKMEMFAREWLKVREGEQRLKELEASPD